MDRAEMRIYFRCWARAGFVHSSNESTPCISYLLVQRVHESTATKSRVSVGRDEDGTRELVAFDDPALESGLRAPRPDERLNYLYRPLLCGPAVCWINGSSRERLAHLSDSIIIDHTYN